MRGRGEWRVALGLVPAMAGVGLASGRELALFFGQLKSAAWAGIMFAAALYGLLVGMALKRGDAAGLDGLARLCEVLRLLLAALGSAFLLTRMGQLGALTLPLRHGYGFGVGFGLLAGLALHRIRPRWGLGLFLLGGLCAFYAAMALDPRPPRLYVSGDTDFYLAGSLPAAFGLALTHAALTACAATNAARPAQIAGTRPVAVGLRSSLLILAPLALAELALMRGGDAIIAHPMPWVALSARWGLWGFWLCAGLEYLCAAATAASMLALLIDRLRRRDRALAAHMLIGAAVVFGVLSWGKV